MCWLSLNHILQEDLTQYQGSKGHSATSDGKFLLSTTRYSKLELFFLLLTKILHFNIALFHWIKLLTINCLLDWRLLTQKTWKQNWRELYYHQVGTTSFNFLKMTVSGFFWKQILLRMKEWIWLLNNTKLSKIGTIIKILMGCITHGQKNTLIWWWLWNQKFTLTMFGSVSLKVHINIQVYYSAWCAPPLTTSTMKLHRVH